jgi:DMSO reductase iron-sulfur subunit
LKNRPPGPPEKLFINKSFGRSGALAVRRKKMFMETTLRTKHRTPSLPCKCPPTQWGFSKRFLAAGGTDRYDIRMKQKSFLFDLNRCTGCGACIIACAAENYGKQGMNWRQVYTFNETRHPAIPLFNLSMACNHCGIPACLKSCPARAISKDPETGAVIVDPAKCLGCKYCTWACPYDAPQYNAARGVIEKCDFCIERLKKGEAPACVCSCPTNALRMEDFDPAAGIETQQVEGFTHAGLQPAIRFKPLRSQQRVPESSAPPSNETINELFESSRNIPQPKISLKSEWTLLTFTSIAFILVALLTAAVVISLPINPFLFLGAGILGTALGTVHLGQKQRAFRAVFNFFNSWLSREIVLFSSFLAISFIYLVFLPAHPVIGWAAVSIGFLGLFAVDRIYQVAMQVGPANFHSAHTFFNGFYLAGILTGSVFIFGGAGLIKLVLYLHRKWLLKKQERKTRPLAGFIRIIFGFIVPLVIFVYNPDIIKSNITGIYGLAIGCVIIGELIDRTEYYDELDIITPRKQMLIDLEKLLKKHRPTKDTKEHE